MVGLVGVDLALDGDREGGGGRLGDRCGDRDDPRDRRAELGLLGEGEPTQRGDKAPLVDEHRGEEVRPLGVCREHRQEPDRLALGEDARDAVDRPEPLEGGDRLGRLFAEGAVGAPDRQGELLGRARASTGDRLKRALDQEDERVWGFVRGRGGEAMLSVDERLVAGVAAQVSAGERPREGLAGDAEVDEERAPTRAEEVDRLLGDDLELGCGELLQRFAGLVV